ncbi:sulfate ABC transporter substrate-binding protein [Thermoleptolyngbya sichuanensis A183]|uniref:Sulfate ABC transporter substrate-binding protein n=1 Tax=Thermoleptolyngbya sichuanensis A183 TaxID=2737172 RepID=A0A6M8B6J7_9CYAN|nr:MULTISPECIES: sulfate ABC transporter substrate-binding protein [Thermoleptolyngbya]QKD81752.1 sulfate ABC transporter substrate-binding protein [Thermoleptolyngbya sichuanensis A183]
MVANFKLRSPKKLLALAATGLSLSMAIAACTPSSTDTASSPAAGESTPAAAAPAKVEITLVSYAVTQAAYENIIPQFVAKWKAEKGQDLVINQSYAGSGTQARAVIDGLEADVVALALALDIQKIEEAGLINEGWEKELPNDSIVHKSVAVLVTREGNPKNIQDWSDLAKDGIQIVTANPKTSGGARWNFLGAWGSVTQNGGTDEQALELTTKLFQNTPILAKDARESTDIFFNQGQGDVLINYENEVLLAKIKGEELPYVVPTTNISIDNPVTVVDAIVDKRGTREVAEAFTQFLFTPEAQEEFAKVGFRPSDPAVAEKFADQFGKVDNLFTVADFGGWDDIQAKFFADGAVFDQIQAKLGK